MLPLMVLSAKRWIPNIIEDVNPLTTEFSYTTPSLTVTPYAQYH